MRLQHELGAKLASTATFLVASILSPAGSTFHGSIPILVAPIMAERRPGHCSTYYPRQSPVSGRFAILCFSRLPHIHAIFEWPVEQPWRILRHGAIHRIHTFLCQC